MGRYKQHKGLTSELIAVGASYEIAARSVKNFIRAMTNASDAVVHATTRDGDIVRLRGVDTDFRIEVI